MGSMISYVRMRGEENRREFGIYSWQKQKGCVRGGKKWRESMPKIIRARAMPYFSHVLVSEKKKKKKNKLPMLKEYIVETERDRERESSDRT